MTFTPHYCPRCGARLHDRHVFGRMRRVCPACGFIFFRDHKVAVGAFIHHRDRVLLVRRAVDPEKGKWALPAGYMEYDEEPIPALYREVAEETGLSVRVTRLLDVFPLRTPHARGVIIMYEAVPEGPVPEHPPAADDVDAVRWFRREAIPWTELAFESTRHILRRWREGQL